jgi:peptidoglycan/xylan/chitin deacetylase (PgdA/CDA1 family)
MNKKYFRSIFWFLLSFVFILNGLQSKVAVAYPESSDNSSQEFIRYYNNTSKIPILMYHSIAYEKGNDLRIPKDKFYLEMKYLKDNGFAALSLDELYEVFSGTAKTPKKPIVITFDDGYRDNYINAYPILKEFHLKAAIFVIAGSIDKSNSYLNSSQIREMIRNGIDVESHTLSHTDLSVLNYKTQYQALKISKEKLENIEGKKVKYLAYPFGKYNKYTEKAAKDAGYIMAVTTKPGFSSNNNGFFFLRRVRMSSSQSLNDFKNFLK